MTRSFHLLHIDDDPDYRALFVRAHQRSGLGGVLHNVPSTAQALLYLNRLPPYRLAPRPKLIVLDLGLPGFGGREFLELLHGQPHLRSIAVVVLTGSEDHHDIARCRELHVHDYLVKPNLYEDLVATIAAFDHWLIGSSTGAIGVS
jgi:CheY-like chemotaxis protein